MTNLFQQQLTISQSLVGGWCMSGSLAILEAMAQLHYDFIVIDFEHGSFSFEQLGHCLRTVAATNKAALIRMPDDDPTKIKQALDLGAQSLLFPFVESPEQAQRIVQSSFYPPQGQRGFARLIRASAYGQNIEYVHHANSQIQLFMQLETPNALKQIASIGHLTGVSGLFIGPGDLSVNMGIPGQFKHPKFQQLLLQSIQQCLASEIVLGTVMPTPELAQWVLKEGIHFSAIASDLANFLTQSQQQLESFYHHKNY